MRVKILKCLIIASVSMMQFTACSGGAGRTSSVILAGIDYSGSVSPVHRRHIRHVLDGLVDGMHIGDHLLVLPIHRNTMTAGYLIDTRLQTREHGRKRQIAIRAQRKELRRRVDSLLMIRMGEVGNQTDILGFIRRAVRLVKQSKRPVQMVIFSDMWQESNTLDFTLRYRETDPDSLAQRVITRCPEFHHHPAGVLLGWIYLPSGPQGYGNTAQADWAHRFWTTFFTRAGIRLEHWDSV